MEHTELVNNLTSECEALGLTLYEHEYHHQVFGSWLLVIGKPHDRLQFSWDGKESYLGVAYSSFNNGNSNPNWESLFPNISGTKTSQIEVFQFISKELNQRYGS